uniref:Arrestin C-terminal-like domain-containing protein n=1 Tax=Acrobeloides nanus TaxID=290746 RepID=A0A914C3F0_9BILA
MSGFTVLPHFDLNTVPNAASPVEPKIPAKTTGSEIVSVQVPSIVPSFNNCSIIQVNYILKIKVDAHGFVNNSITFDFPILIGTYPIVKQHINPPAYPMPPSDYIAPPQPTAPPAEIFSPLPSYAECMFGQGTMALEDEDTKYAGNIGFAPRYLLYNNFPTSP